MPQLVVLKNVLHDRIANAGLLQRVVITSSLRLKINSHLRHYFTFSVTDGGVLGARARPRRASSAPFPARGDGRRVVGPNDRNPKRFLWMMSLFWNALRSQYRSTHEGRRGNMPILPHAPRVAPPCPHKMKESNAYAGYLSSELPSTQVPSIQTKKIYHVKTACNTVIVYISARSFVKLQTYVVPL